MKEPARHLALLAATLLAVPAAAQTTWHVDAGAGPGGDGLSWATAYATLDDALDVVVMGDQIWVKRGLYRPDRRLDPADPRSVTFDIPIGVPCYGGFVGYETTLDARAGVFDQTILSGDLGIPGDSSDNAYHVVRANNPSGIPADYTTIDGFTIRDGNAVGVVGGHGPVGAGVLHFNSALLLRNCIIRDNRAGWGAGLHAQPALVNIRWCEFIDNHAVNNGGAIWGQSLNLKVSHCRFRGNSATKGGAAYFHSIYTGHSVGDRVAFIGSVFHDNHAVEGGAVLIAGGSGTAGSAVFYHCTIAYNRATDRGGGILARGGTNVVGSSTLRNCVVWGNVAPLGPNLRGRQHVQFSDIEGGEYQSGGNISADPLFVDGPNRDLRLLSGSPANDSGLNTLIPRDYCDVDGDGKYHEPIPIDLDRTRRITDDPLAPNSGGGTLPVVDMGAFEW